MSTVKNIMKIIIDYGIIKVLISQILIELYFTITFITISVFIKLRLLKF